MGRIDLYMLLNPALSYNLPNEHFNNWTYSISTSRISDSFSTKKAVLMSSEGSNFVMAVFNPENYNVHVEAILELRGIDLF
jgi:hypothetical protein